MVTTDSETCEEFEIESNNLHEGYMFLRNRSLFRQWMLKPQYFILTPHYIYCFKRRGDLTSIPRDVMPLDYLSVSIDNDTKGLRKHFYIKLDSPVTKKTFTMFCFSNEERDQWLTMILQVLAKNFLDSEYIHRYLKTSYSSRSLSRLTGCSVNNAIELNKQSSLSCMELTNFGFNHDKAILERIQRRQTLGNLFSNENDELGEENVDSSLQKACSFSSYHICSIQANPISAEKENNRKRVKRNNSMSSSILRRLNYISNMNVRNSSLGNSIRTSLVGKFKR